ncbi:hypothetical protein JCM8547_002557 [Rhodosporidiobolus lusitaniae]
MLNSARTFATRSATARRAVAVVRPSLPPSSVLALHSSARARQAEEPLPWFVDPSSAPSAPTSPSSSVSPLATAPVPTPPPSHLFPALHPLHDHLSVSPFFDKDSLTYIHTREADPEGSWTDWVVIATLREGRERGIRGAAEGVRTFLAKTPLDLAPPPSSSDFLSSSAAQFSPSSSSPIVSGILPAPSKHARSRSNKGGPPPTRSDNATGWALVDAGRVVVHVMTPEARETYGRGVEEVWEVQGWRKEKRREDRERELEENMEALRREMEVEQAAART